MIFGVPRSGLARFSSSSTKGTVSPSAHPAYNPYSFQNGSIWPHDNSIISSRFRRGSYAEEAGRIAREVWGAGGYFVHDCTRRDGRTQSDGCSACYTSLPYQGRLVKEIDVAFGDHLKISHNFHFIELLLAMLSVLLTVFPAHVLETCTWVCKNWNMAQNSVQLRLMEALLKPAAIVGALAPTRLSLQRYCFVDREGAAKGTSTSSLHHSIF